MKFIIGVIASLILVTAQAAEKVWNGGAGTRLWADAANWTGGLPTADDTVKLANGAVVVADATAVCTSVDLAGGTLVLSVADETSLGFAVGGTGVFDKAGTGVLTVQAGAFAATVTLCVDDGQLDLNGTAQTVAGVKGGGILTNGADAQATLTIASAGETTLEPLVSGNVKVVKTGAGKLSVRGAKTYSGDTLVSEGGLAAAPGCAVEALGGCVVHLDAMRTDTLKVNAADNKVLEWRSTAGDGLVFSPYPREGVDGFPAADEFDVDTPTYNSRLANGLPALQCGENAAGEKALTFLFGNKTIAHRTVILVQVPMAPTKPAGANLLGYSSYGHPFFTDGSADNDRILKKWWGSSGKMYGQLGTSWNGGYPYVYMNGLKEWDPDGSVYNPYGENRKQGFMSKFDTAPFNYYTPHVVTMVLPENANTVSFRPAVGVSGRIYWDGMKRGGDTSDADWFIGKLCEVIVFNRSLSDTERLTIETELMRKWNLPHRSTPIVDSPLSANSAYHVVGGTTLDTGSGLGKVAALAVDSGSLVCDVPADEVRSLAAGSISGPGCLEKRGEGTLQIVGAKATTGSLPALTVDDGQLDLCGSELKVSTAIGGGEIVNTATDEANLIVANDAASKLQPKVTGAVKVTKSGAGRMEVRCLGAQTADIELGGGTVAAVTGVPVESVAGCVIHLDAMRADTIDYDPADYTVRAWRSTAGDGVVFREYNDQTRGSGPAVENFPTDRPIYKPTGIGGQLPCVTGGAKLDGSRTLTLLFADKLIDHRTIILVQMPTPGPYYYSGYGNPFFIKNDGISENAEKNRLFRRWSVSNGAQYMSCNTGWNNGDVYMYLNAIETWNPTDGCVYGTLGKDGHFYFNVNGDAKPHVISMVLPEGASTVSFHPSVCAGGRIHWDGMTLNDDGSYRITDWFVGSVCEVLVFDRSLADAERREIETMLLTKWSLTAKGALRTTNPLPGPMALAVTDSTTLDVGGFAANIGSLTFCAGTASFYPVLTVSGLLDDTLDLTSSTLAFEGGENVVKGQKILAAPGATVSGPFADVSGLPDGGRVSYRTDCVRYSASGLAIILR